MRDLTEEEIERFDFIVDPGNLSSAELRTAHLIMDLEEKVRIYGDDGWVDAEFDKRNKRIDELEVILNERDKTLAAGREMLVSLNARTKEQDKQVADLMKRIKELIKSADRPQYINLPAHPPESESAGCVAYTKDLGPIVIDYDANDEPIGVEFICYLRREDSE